MMDRNKVFQELNAIFQEVFDDESIELTEDTSSNDIEEWDSFEHVNLVIAIEAKFKIKFDMNEVNQMKNVGEMADSICRKAGSATRPE